MKKEIFSYRRKIIQAGEIYHITQRAPGKEIIFVEDADYLNMLSLLKEWVKEFDIEIFSLCLMPNHYHLLLRINKPNLSQAMQSLNTTYAMRFNTKYKRKGHVFCGVYRASMCLDDLHFLGSSLYIHLNPQKAHLVEKAEDYRWSSINVFIHSETKSFVNKEFILQMVNEDLEKASSLYKEMLENYSKIKYDSILENSKAVVGFCKQIFRNLPKFLSKRLINKDFISKEVHLDEMIEEFKKKKRKNAPENKKAFLYLLEQLKSRGFNMSQIAKILNVSRPSLYNLTTKVEP